MLLCSSNHWPGTKAQRKTTEDSKKACRIVSHLAALEEKYEEMKKFDSGLKLLGNLFAYLFIGAFASSDFVSLRCHNMQIRYEGSKGFEAIRV